MLNITIEDVARKAGVAKSTASAALNGKEGKYGVSADTRAAVLEAAQHLGFEADPHARRLANGRCDTSIGIFISDFDTGVGTIKIREIQSLLSEQGYDVAVHSHLVRGVDYATSQAKLMSQLRRQKPLAIISYESDIQEGAVKELERYIDEGGIVICYDHAHGQDVNVPCDRVIFDREEHSYLATRYLMDIGHRKIGLYVNGLTSPGSERLAGFCRALKEQGGETHPEWMFHGLYEEGGRQMAARFLELQERPTAMCIVNDNAAVAFISELQHAGLNVPDDVSVMGHDNLSFAPYATVPLTVMTHPVEEISHSVSDLLVDRAQRRYRGAPRQVRVQGTLIVRQSTAPLDNR